MNRPILFTALMLATAPALALNLLPGSAEEVTCQACPPPPPPGVVEVPVEVIKEVPAPPVPLNAHAEIHPAEAKLMGYDYCSTCHTIGGGTTGNAKSVGKGICSQAQFCGQPTNVPGGKSCATGIVVPNAAGTGPLFDPVSKKSLSTGGYTAYYSPGQEVRCSDCHNMKVQVGNRGWSSSSQIHEGCKDCHTKAGSSSLKPGVSH